MRKTMTRMRGSAIAVLVVAPSLVLAVPLIAQRQDSASGGIEAPYLPPELALAEPINGAGLPQDKPSVVFRYAEGEADDPLALSTFAVSVDGEIRSAQFHVDSTKAWGSIDPLAAGASAGQPLALGVHQLTARICSSRGICTDTRATVTVLASAIATTDSPSTHKSRLLAFLTLVFALIEKLFTL